ncbi:(2,3-dihydroxybenzoyl)adenylate synthase [Thalassolituus sp. ST750PaO-4]|uniref:(2,3-dihydroxybenzoyl)adenylate synthase n=1 Tax=Thalassolituus sp. ST750PaO-4 TaxID=2742965 RepID=UPI001CE33764|nr:(2,3-dihydroxybenzoyl)adenylate synthase [Thalassolituus sp. ST750PaO-4]MCA6059382.1 (2,3-dihydroxybenzoyl)adenylate synthase [Thalassolituus sp. ST750PaO-4]
MRPSLPFNRWPQVLEDEYRGQGFWLDLPLSNILQRHRDNQGTAVICGERHFSYAELNRLSNNLAAQFVRRGLGVGDTALVQLPNIAEFYIVFFALLKAGIAPVNALFSHQKLELRAYASQLNPALLVISHEHPLFTDEVFTAELKTLAPALDLVCSAGESNFALHLSSLCSMTVGVDVDVDVDADIDCNSAAEEVAFFQLSGGSTGTPKLIPRTHNDYYYSVRRSAEICQLDGATRYLCALPAAHNYPLSSPGALGVFFAGGCVVMARDPEPLRCFSLIEKYGVTMTALVPSAVILWLQAAPGYQQQLSSLKLLQVGGASFAEALARRVPVELGCQLQQVFGMAEGLVNYTRLNDSDERIFTTQGCPMSSADEVWVVDPESHTPVACGQTGMLMTRGPYTFRGYFNAAEHNASAFNPDGFYISGDLVTQDENGYLRVVGRVKDQINRGGEKIAAEEIENILLRHPDVLQAALISVPDALLGEKSLACIVARQTAGQSELKPVALRKYLRAQGVAEFKLPDRFQFMASLPLTAVGKTDKKELRQQIFTAAPAI